MWAGVRGVRPLFFLNHPHAMTALLNVDFGEHIRAQWMIKRYHPGKHTQENKALALPVDRTVFIVNLPIFSQPADLSKTLAPFGRVERVSASTFSYPSDSTSDYSPGLSKRERRLERERAVAAADACLPPSKISPRLLSQHTACYVVFLDAASVQKLLQCTKTVKYVQAHPSFTGFDRYTQLHDQRRPDLARIQSDADYFIAEYEQHRHQQHLLDQQLHNTPDEDGFVTVSRKGARRGVVHGTAGASVIAAKKRDIHALHDILHPPKKKNKQELVNFYRFQIKQHKRDQILALQHKFEQDKKRLARIRQQRRFAPM